MQSSTTTTSSNPVISVTGPKIAILGKFNQLSRWSCPLLLPPPPLSDTHHHLLSPPPPPSFTITITVTTTTTISVTTTLSTGTAVTVVATSTPRWPPAPSTCASTATIHHTPWFAAILHPLVVATPATRPRETTACRRRRTTSAADRAIRPPYASTPAPTTLGSRRQGLDKGRNTVTASTFRDDDDLRHGFHATSSIATTTEGETEEVEHGKDGNDEDEGQEGQEREGVVDAEEGGRVRQFMGQGGGRMWRVQAYG
ncbi:hypothetical protein CPC08DRAFT_761954 [Agrocybe pediades]|nr:hypothetical protein CPC08DRAFT_761954 [Agrocybe pediades]